MFGKQLSSLARVNTTATQRWQALSESATIPAPHLYIHVPFCATKCHYCAFYSEPSDGETMNHYLDALERELAHWAPQLRPETIFFGGGTPTLLNLRQLERLLSTLNAQLSTSASEFTFESNPATLSLDKARLLRAHGVNRISMGVQSFDERVLEKLGRIHTPEQARRSYDLLRQAGFDNVNVDLMFALPGQSMSDWEHTLRQAMALQPEHISTYCLTFEEDTIFWRLFSEGVLAPNEEQEAEMYQRTWDILETAGYQQYEISNFARKRNSPLSTQHSALSTFACAHNIGYWRCEDCIGLGPSAASNRGERRWKNIANTDEYIARLSRGEPPIDFEETLDVPTRAGEYVAFGLRMNDGVSRSAFRRRFGVDLDDLWSGELPSLLQDCMVEWRGDHLCLTPRGMLLADEVSAHFVAPGPDRGGFQFLSTHPPDPAASPSPRPSPFGRGGIPLRVVRDGAPQEDGHAESDSLSLGRGPG
jgi:oxygen-independent coproporphyrinogen-3 oxidase